MTAVIRQLGAPALTDPPSCVGGVPTPFDNWASGIGTWVEFGGISVYVDKFSSDETRSSLLVTLRGTCYANAPGLVRFGIKYGFTNYEICRYYFSAVNDHRQWGGTQRLDTGNIIGGTATPIWSTWGSGAVISADQNDWISLSAREVLFGDV